MRSIVENNFDGILIVRQDGTIELANAASLALFRHTQADLNGVRVTSLMPDIANASEAPGAAIEMSCGRRELLGMRADGSSFPVEVATSEIAEPDSRLFVAVVHDISARRARQQELEHQALHDLLTGLPNRRLIMDRLDHALSVAAREEKPLALLLLDLDRFKEVNDTLGHQVGDALLRQVARRLPGALRRSDTVGRLGGDEFAVVLPAVTDLAKASAIAWRIVESLAEPFQVESFALEVGASIGIALYPDHAEDATRLLRCADVAMYAAKRERARFALYEHDKDDNSLRNLALTGELAGHPTRRRSSWRSSRKSICGRGACAASRPWPAGSPRARIYSTRPVRRTGGTHRADRAVDRLGLGDRARPDGRTPAQDSQSDHGGQSVDPQSPGRDPPEHGRRAHPQVGCRSGALDT